ncbi:glycosyltransferase family 4 protein [Iodobacter fluviatilis]|uniref:Glycosyltransferase involved in cell wall biosynthesis n=1 Tax=Iodobacter fluviatilis TaxID=537 RepID=A0A377SWX4_9NEIS|nr:glycosyltransferase family 1 protein [Iodobacter fluviatilis]TCU87982.1 glycosyltransferase involved in cell wall biosynthesis [Iodobacter fluviatilis]STR45483.1 glycosyltransferase, MSMEG_0565 family [Iodobacter fluviatilis]
MKILVDARPINGAMNGIGRYVLNLIIALSYNDEVEIVLVSNKKIVLSPELDFSRVQIIVDKKYSKVPGTIWWVSRANTLAKENNVNWVLGTQHILPPRKSDSLKYGVIVHDLVHRYFPWTMSKYNYLVSKIFFYISLRNADKVFTVSNTTKINLLDVYGESVNPTTLYPGITKLPMASKPKEDVPEKFIFALGSFEKRKNLEKLIDVYTEYSLSNPDVHLVLAGSMSWGNNELLCRIEKFSGPGKIVIFRNLNDAQISYLFESCSVFVFPSIYEGFGLPILEAAGRCKIILNTIPIFKEIADQMTNVSFLDFSKDKHEVAESLNLYIKQLDTKSDFKESIKFSWKKSADILVDSLKIT